MCGICGIFGEEDEPAVGAMVDRLRHRGPDDRGVTRGHRFTIGMSRLSILDPSPAGHQPMSTPDGKVWIVYNGETYNFAELRRSLESKGHRFRSRSDTEVVLHLYDELGDDFLRELRGIFALAIVDLRGGPGRERLLLARDPLGVKPLLVASTPKGLVFASELRALLGSGRVAATPDPESLRLLLSFGSVPQPRTLLRGVEMIPPAHRMIVENGNTRLERYWSLGLDRRPEFGAEASPEERIGRLTALLEETVRAQLVSDVPIGAFLSGGLDSSILVALMARATATPVRTFSVGFDSDESDTEDETDAAAATAAFLGTEHRRVRVDGRRVRDAISSVARSLDQPSVDGTNSYFVSEAAARDVKVALSGTGGDELFAGYPWFYNLWSSFGPRPDVRSWIADHWPEGRSPGAARGPVGRRLRAWKQRAGFRESFASQYQIFDEASAAGLLAPELRADAHAGRRMAADLVDRDELATAPTLARVTGLCLRGYTSHQLLRDIDAASMAHSLEVRVPYLDVDLVDAALSLPDDAKIVRSPGSGNTYRDGLGKWILVEVGRRLLPEGFDARPKRGFELPNGAWLRGQLREVLEATLAADRVRDRGWLVPAAADKVRSDFLDGRIAWPRPWLLMMTELWFQEVVDPHTAAPPAQARRSEVA